MTRLNPMILVSLVLTMLVLFVVIYFSMLVPNRSAEPLTLITGEWAPYSGQHIEGNGITAAIVGYILSQMGYQAKYEFMPWQLGENLVATSQLDDAPRGTFPYVITQGRSKRYYLSDSIIDIDYGVFYNRELAPEAANIRSAGDLKDFRVLTLAGYDYLGAVRNNLPAAPCNKQNTLDAFRFLATPNDTVLVSMHPLDVAQRHANIFEHDLVFSDHFLAGFSDERSKPAASYKLYSGIEHLGEGVTTEKELAGKDLIVIQRQVSAEVLSALNLEVCTQQDEQSAVAVFLNALQPLVLIEARDVGEELLAQQIPHIKPVIERAPFVQKMQLAVMFSRNNPNNLALRDTFNERLAELKSNSSAFDELVERARNKVNMARAVRVEPFGAEELVKAYRFDPESRDCDQQADVFLPKGTRAVVTQWHQVFLQYDQPLSKPMVKVRLLNGPMAKSQHEMCVDGRAIRLQ